MLEQYRKDLPANDDKDLLPDNETMSRRKLLFIISGAAFAFVFFLFLMGMFRSDEDTLAVKESRGEGVTKEHVLALEDKIQSLLTRIEKLETEAQATPAFAVQSSKESQEPAAEIAEIAPLNSPEDAVAMTNQALRQMISKTVEQAAAADVAIADSLLPKKDSAQKLAKAKAKKAKEKIPLITSPNSAVYVVQKGDTLTKISQRYFGTPNRWMAIYEANRDRIANKDQLKVGTTLAIPK